MFSHRVLSDLAPNRLFKAVEQLRAQGRPILDLTLSNPTCADFEYPDDLLHPLAARRGLRYAPEPFGLPDAREAVAADYRRRGVPVDAGRIVLTASTSEAYSLLFKVLCDPQDEVLVPRPSYPLFEHLTRLDSVQATPYDLEYHGTWSIDLASVERAWSPRTRAVLVVSPNNPTGSFITPDELDAVAARCAAGGAAIVADEVFADYELIPGSARRAGQVLSRNDALVFSLGGLSKSVGLPQAKLGWIAVGGPDALVAGALSRLELACDTYLSVSTPVQAAARELLTRGAGVRAQIQARVTSSYQLLLALAAQSPACTVLTAAGGWYAVLQVPSFDSEEAMVVTLLTRDGVLAHPGYFFDFPRESYLIVSLLAPEPAFREGMERVLRHFDCSATGYNSL